MRNVVVQPNPEVHGTRLSFQLAAGSEKAIELRAQLDARRRPALGGVALPMDALTAARPPAPAGFLPAEAPLRDAGPVARRARCRRRRFASPKIALRRLFVFGSAALLSALAAL